MSQVLRERKRPQASRVSRKRRSKPKNICVTERDYQLLTALIERRQSDGVDIEYLNKLEAELDRADIVAPEDISDDVITMGSKVRVKDLPSGKVNIYSLVLPNQANLADGKISVLAPIGTAMLGYRLGDTIEWEVPSGMRRLRVEEILYQPERAGDHQL